MNNNIPNDIPEHASGMFLSKEICMIRIMEGIKESSPAEKYFVLDTDNTTYAFRTLPTGQLEHLYYGRKIKIADTTPDVLSEKHAFPPGNTCSYDDEHGEYTLDDMRLEMSANGKSDMRDPLLEIIHADGSTTSDFIFEGAQLLSSKEDGDGLPGAYYTGDAGKDIGLKITLRDNQYGLKLELYYYVFEKCNVIVRKSRLINESTDTVTVGRLLSAQLDLDRSDLVFTTFRGAWGREMQRDDCIVGTGRHIAESYYGVSSNRCNPFIMLHPAQTTEKQGECYAYNLIYSGNHYEAVEANAFGKVRFVGGINPRGFAWKLGPNETFDSPEAVLTYSANGYNAMSRNMHSFVNEHIVRGEWKGKDRPVLLNSWEAAYFDINESKLVKLAKAAKDVGAELFVMDDGWFGERNDDRRSLGDWDVNKKKLPGGLKGIADKINGLGLHFGIWVEPEMVNKDSRLYNEHPDWAMKIPDKPHSEGRWQMLLDLCNPEVTDFIIDKMSEVFSSANIDYVKWDMNRPITDYYSQYLPADRQGEVAHRYYLGLYRCMKTLTERFPNILFEGCASGGNRFDLGILSYFPQIWASDDTDAVSRAYIQTGYSYGYPQSTYTAHVSASPNHQTLRRTPLDTRFNVAVFGNFGYELNLCDLSKEDLAKVKAQIELYKKWRHILQWGDFYRGRSFNDSPAAAGSSPYGISASAGMSADTAGNLCEWTICSKDKRQAVSMLMQKLTVPNSMTHVLYPDGLDEEKIYRFYNRELKVDIREFGDLVNMMAPVHLKNDSMLMDIAAHFVKLDGETENFTASGSTLMYGGAHLHQSYGGTGFNSDVRHFQDFGSRLYFMEAT